MDVMVKPGLTQAWRSESCLQLGLDPTVGTVIEGLTDHDRALVTHVTNGVDITALGARARELVTLLGRRGLLTRIRVVHPRQRTATRRAWRSRMQAESTALGLRYGTPTHDGWDYVRARQCRVVDIHGGDRLGQLMAALLNASGVGTVRVVDERSTTLADVSPGGAYHEQVGLPREQVAQLNAAQFGSGTAAKSRTADVVVLVEPGVADSVAAHALVTAGQPHLSVNHRELTTVVGPLVLPGHSACLGCLDRHRLDADPLWMNVATQVVDNRPSTAGQVPGAATASMASALATLQILTYLDGLPQRTADPAAELEIPTTVGATLELTYPQGLLARRVWARHPRCACHQMGVHSPA